MYEYVLRFYQPFENIDVHPDVKGNLILDSGCGANFVTMLSNHAHQTSLQCGLVCIPKANELKCDLPLKVDESEGGAAILLCSASCESRVKAKLSAFGALYLLRYSILFLFLFRVKYVLVYHLDIEGIRINSVILEIFF